MPYEKNRQAVAPAASNPPAPQGQDDRRASGPSPLATSTSGQAGDGHMARSRRGSRVSSASDSSAVCLDLNDSDDDGGEPQQLSTSKTQHNDMLFVDLTLRRGSVLETSKGDLSATTTTATTVAVTPSWSTCLPIYAAYTIKSSVYVLILAFLLPLAIKNGPALRHPGLLQGQLHALDALSIVYLCYLALVVLLTPLLGAVHDATFAAAGKRNASLHILLGALCVGPIALFALLSSASSSSSSSMPVGEEHVAWTAVVVVMGCNIVAVEMSSALLLADLTQLQGLGTSSGAIAMMNGKASLVGVGLATVLVGIPALVASLALETGPLAAARYACIATVLVNLTGTLYVVFVQVCLASVVAPPQAQQQQQQQQQQQRPRAGGGGLGQSNHLHQQQQQQQRQWTSTMAVAFRALRPKVLFRVLALSPPLFVHFLLLRTFYQAGFRCLTYLGSTYILHNLELDVYIATKAVIMAFCAALLGMGMTLALLSAHEKKVQKQRDASRFRRASSASAATAVGAVIAAARVEQDVVSSPSAGFGSSSTALDAPEKTPLLIALALLTVLLAASPTDVANSSNPSSAVSRDLGLLYILASISGMCFGFVSTYEKGILASMLWPLGAQQQQQAAVVAGIGVGQFCGLFVALSASLEWFPTLLFAVFTRYAVPSAMWAFILFFGLSFVIFAVFVILEGVREGRRSEGGGGGGGGGGRGSTDSSSPDSRPQLSMSRRMSFFLLRSLPSHLSTIVESPFGGTQHGGERSSSIVSPASLSSLSTAASEDSLGRAAEAWRGGGGGGREGGRGGAREMEGGRGRSQSSIR